MDNFAKDGLRCLAFGYREFTHDKVEWEKNKSNKGEPVESFEIATKITFLGLVGIKDPIRKEVRLLDFSFLFFLNITAVW